GGPAPKNAQQISTTALRGILQYEPRDLTVSVEAGMPFADLSRELARHNQMIPLDGPYVNEGTVGGVIAANISGARRRLYGSARDLVIGMKFVTLDGKLVQSGGMVVKNVAGLDMGKLMIGSFGTLAAIASINFKLVPKPIAARTLLFTYDDSKSAFAARDACIRGVLNPAAADILNPILSAQLNLPGPPLKGFILALQFVGNAAVIERAAREAESLGAPRSLNPDDEARFWTALANVTPRHMEIFREGAVGRLTTTLSDCAAALASVEGPGHVHAASGIVRGWFSRADAVNRWLASAHKKGWKGVVECAGDSVRPQLNLWPAPGPDFEIMKSIKRMFDPEGLLNAGRLYGLL
ncbi:MAG: FAD-binding oxidoreductase, partial [Acidobacteriota bacterium]|nr:FAD-binding oxidoreductase [Acidobacteriota bacterium]